MIIAKLEAASEGSRELDREIDRQMGSKWEGKYAPYTQSIDAALSLVPERWYPSLIAWNVEILSEPNDRVWATVVRHGPNDLPDGGHRMGTAATPALALCIAALKAREEKKDAISRIEEPI